MISSLLKGFSLSSIGAVGIGTFAPIFYEGVTFPYREVLWKRELDWDGYIGTCIFKGNNTYFVKLYLSAGGGTEKSFDKGKGISAFVVATKIPKDSLTGKQEDKKFTSGWSLKKIGTSSGTIGMNLGTNTLEGEDSHIDNYNSQCYLKIQEKESQSLSSGLEPQNIKFECDSSKYKKEIGRAECDITFAADTKLKWKDGFKPKLIWRAF